jgi:hypothetical protein
MNMRRLSTAVAAAAARLLRACVAPVPLAAYQSASPRFTGWIRQVPGPISPRSCAG